MPDTLTSEKIISKPSSGSSKRKRKQSIKRNIKEEGLQCNDFIKVTKIERLLEKRTKFIKEKSENNSDEINESSSNMSDDVIQMNESTVAENSTQNVPFDIDPHETQKYKLENSNIEKCSSVKQECQNCKFCSEHTVIKEDIRDSNNKKNKKRFTCENCAKEGSTKVYNSVEKYNYHMATVHGIIDEEVKRFECTECPEAIWFPTKSKFTYHLGSRHPGIIKFVCEICTETFKLKANYKTHMQSHNVVIEKKFSCDVCNGSFVNKAGYEAHKKRFPGPHIRQSCTHCGFTFSKEKHLQNHRCKKLLLEEAAARAHSTNQTQQSKTIQGSEDIEIILPDTIAKTNISDDCQDKKVTVEASTETDTDILLLKKAVNNDLQSNKRILLHRIVQRKNPEQTTYRPVQMQSQNINDSVVVQEVREINLEGGTFIAAASGESDQQFIVRDINGHLVQGNQILQLDINEVQQGEESQVYLADWNIVAPYVIREKSP